MLILFSSLITPYNVRTVTRRLGVVLVSVAAIAGSSAVALAQEDRDVKGSKLRRTDRRLSGA